MDFLIYLLALSPEVAGAQAAAWLAVAQQLFVPLTALAAVVFAFLSFVRSNVNKLHAVAMEQRLDRQVRRTENLQTQITDVALATPGPVNPVNPVNGNGNGHTSTSPT
jgi:hypothetical protein